jgi:hypothetical protein
MTTITEAAPQPSNFTAAFTIKVNAIRTATVNGLADTVKQVEWTLIGEEAGQKFELPQSTNLGDPDSANFVPLTSLTETAVIAWIEATETRMSNIKAHIQYVLEKEIARASLTSTPMPWAPVVENPEPPISAQA